MKIGDKLYCKKTCVSTFLEFLKEPVTTTLFVEKHSYTFRGVENNMFKFDCEHFSVEKVPIDAILIDKTEIKQHFYTQPQLRRLKLKKIHTDVKNRTTNKPTRS